MAGQSSLDADGDVDARRLLGQADEAMHRFITSGDPVHLFTRARHMYDATRVASSASMRMEALQGLSAACMLIGEQTDEDVGDVVVAASRSFAEWAWTTPGLTPSQRAEGIRCWATACVQYGRLDEALRVVSELPGLVGKDAPSTYYGYEVVLALVQPLVARGDAAALDQIRALIDSDQDIDPLDRRAQHKFIAQVVRDHEASAAQTQAVDATRLFRPANATYDDDRVRLRAARRELLIAAGASPKVTKPLTPGDTRPL